MFKHNFIALTVSLLIFSVLSVLNPQPQEMDQPINDQRVLFESQEEIEFDLNETQMFVVGYTIRKMAGLEEDYRPVSLDEDLEEEAKEEPVTKTVTQPKQTSTPTATKTEPKQAEAPKEETKESSEPESVKSEPVTQTEQPKEEPKTTVSSSVKSEFAEWQAEIVRLTNEARKNAGLNTLSYKSSLDAGAIQRATEIITHFSHTRPDGSRFFTVFGPDFRYRSVGENLARGFRNPQSVFDAWMNSDGHRANILSTKYEEISVAIVRCADGRYHWVQIFYRG